jgi:hypothetical protein
VCFVAWNLSGIADYLLTVRGGVGFYEKVVRLDWRWEGGCAEDVGLVEGVEELCFHELWELLC